MMVFVLLDIWIGLSFLYLSVKGKPNDSYCAFHAEVHMLDIVRRMLHTALYNSSPKRALINTAKHVTTSPHQPLFPT